MTFLIALLAAAPVLGLVKLAVVAAAIEQTTAPEE